MPFINILKKVVMAAARIGCCRATRVWLVVAVWGCCCRGGAVCRGGVGLLLSGWCGLSWRCGAVVVGVVWFVVAVWG
ncbi:hypothetical protein, partial [Bartonella tribocorum]|uniref:hypothetical protein n=1 Tax=Bartonella tribocorum TaxID=85701 RepID=UPI001ABAC539